MTSVLLAACAPLLVVLLVVILCQGRQTSHKRREAGLSRVNAQLRELYGPLKVLTEINEGIREAAEDERGEQGGTPPMTHRKMRDVIVANADLLIETELPQPLRDFCVHVTAHECTIPSQPNHPHGQLSREFVEYVRESFTILTNEQRSLLKSVTHLSRHDSSRDG